MNLKRWKKEKSYLKRVKIKKYIFFYFFHFLHENFFFVLYNKKDRTSRVGHNFKQSELNKTKQNKTK